MQPHYSIDTSALVDWWTRYYPPATFPTLQSRIEDLIAEGRLRASREVLTEIERQDDDLCKWAKATSDFFVESDVAIQKYAKTLINDYHNAAKPQKGINGADAFVIALAACNSPPWFVVACENPGSAENPKIPYVCNRASPRVEVINFLQFIAKEGWKF